MNCLICGESPTIKSHLIPRVMAVEVQVGNAHAVVSPSSPGYRESQSGRMDTSILCGACDSSIGSFEGSTAKAFESLRNAGVGVRDGVLVTAEQAPDVTLRFYAALLWKYAVARRDLGQIDLGPYKSELQKMAFESAPIPDFFDAALMRLRLNPDDAGVFAYRAPKPDRKDGINMYRVLVGGVLAFVKVDRRPWGNTLLNDVALSRATNTRALVMAAQRFEEFKTLQHLAHNDIRLSAFLDRNDARAAQKA
ncbi:hypothetical protein [Pandoraea anhela]|uniref:HNH endonuclease n=1 Tax=Pandoraea anhela TaxID=2508295 RepID=A0A5E4Z4S3_9BURK|nr:hypothetical protein [Pandoraea anhela]VVE56126.1 hypothetical protein PAN31108_05067 [Pandoraea anhela]